MRADPQRLLTPAEVAAKFRVDPKTVSRWQRKGLLSCIRTLGNHRRLFATEVEALLRDGPQATADLADLDEEDEL
jgi:excisionase family DNA binding protein